MNADQELKIRQRLGHALMEFVQKVMDPAFTEDTVMQQVHTQTFRREVERAAQRGIEVSLVWHTLGTWTEMGKERIGYFSRAIDALDAEMKVKPHESCHELWARSHSRTECLYEIGRVHAHEGDPGTAREFLEKARSYLFVVDAARDGAKEDGHNIPDDNLEGKIAALLVQLPDEGETLDAVALEPEE